MTEKWSFSTSTDSWHHPVYPSRKAAIDAGRSFIEQVDPAYFREHSHFYVGRMKSIPKCRISASELLNQIASDLYMQHHKVAGEEAFSGVTAAQKMELEQGLQQVFNSWIIDHDCDPTEGHYNLAGWEMVPFSSFRDNETAIGQEEFLKHLTEGSTIRGYIKGEKDCYYEFNEADDVRDVLPNGLSFGEFASLSFFVVEEGNK
jgi:hypothetical protein